MNWGLREEAVLAAAVESDPDMDAPQQLPSFRTMSTEGWQKPPAGSALSRLLAKVRETRFGRGVFCPRCGHREVQLWGTFRHRQRYRCKGCARTFSDLTGTPAAHLKKPELLPLYARCMEASLSVRRTAWRVGIDPKTSFRWRHRLCDDLRAHDRETVSGWVELASLWMPESRKGERGLDRAPRDRGLWYEALEAPQVHVVLACDRQGHQVAIHDPSPAPRHRTFPLEALESALGDRLEGRVCLTAEEGPFGRFARVARRLGVPFVDCRPPRPRVDPGPSRGTGRMFRPAHLARLPPVQEERQIVARSLHLAHVGRAKEYRRSLKAWLAPFCGVATKYLGNYLVWHRGLGNARRYGLAISALRWPAGGAGGLV